MQFKMKRKTPEIVSVATTDGATRPARESNGSPLPSLAGEPSGAADEGARAPTAASVQHPESLELLRDIAEMLLTGDAGIQEVFAELKPALELDAVAAYAAATGEPALTLETASGLSATAISGTAVASILAELARSGSRTLVLESLRHQRDPRAAVFRDLGFTAVIVGALAVADRPLGAIVFATRSKERFGAAERTLIDGVVCCLNAAYERREHARRLYNAEHGKREFLTVLAHELRNPLAPVRNALEIIRTNDRARSPVEDSAYAMIERQLEHIARLADDLLDANQVILGQVELAKQSVLLDAVIARAAEQSRPWVEAARHGLVLELPREAIALDADPKRLARAFSNLINHAARCMDRGGRVVISAKVTDGTITIFVRARGRAISGESEAFAESVAQTATAARQSQGGVTAGMTLVKHLVEMHGGSVSAHANADGVAEFEVRLPAVGAVAAPSRQAPYAAVDEGAEPAVPHRILIADDNADAAESMGMLLRLMGNDVRIASDGLEAVEQAAQFRPDIVLMDIGMPRLDGYEAARRIRNQVWSRDTLLVAVTGWGSRDDSEEATAAGFDHRFTKPLDPAELRRLVSGARPPVSGARPH